MKDELLKKIAEIRKSAIENIQQEIDTTYKKAIESRIAELISTSTVLNEADGVLINNAIVKAIEAVEVPETEVDFTDIEVYVEQEVTKIQDEAGTTAVSEVLPEELKSVLLTTDGKIDKDAVELVKANIADIKQSEEFERFKASDLVKSLGEDVKELTIADYMEIAGSISKEVLAGVLDGTIKSNLVLSSVMTEKAKAVAKAPENDSGNDTPFKQATNGMASEEVDAYTKDLDLAVEEVLKDIKTNEAGNYIDPTTQKVFTKDEYREVIKEKLILENNPE